MIVIYSTDRVWRATLEQALRAHRVDVRVASRQAELAKCLTQAAVTVLITGPDARSQREAAHTVTMLAPQLATGAGLYVTTPDDTMEIIVRQALALRGQGTSSE